MRYLRHNKSENIPSRHIFVDTESRRELVPGSDGVWRHRLRLWCAEYWTFERGAARKRDEMWGEDARVFWDWVYEQSDARHSLWVWAHNMSWDFAQLHGWREIESQYMHIEEPAGEFEDRQCVNPKAKRWQGLLVLDRDCFIIGCRTKCGHAVSLISSTNYFRMPLADLAARYGAKKTAVDFDAVSDADLAEHCRVDTEILARACTDLLSWQRRHDMGKFRYTVGGLSMAAFRHRFMDHHICIHKDPDARKFERDAHFGGETVCYRFGKVGSVVPVTGETVEDWVDQTWDVPTGPVYELDVSSLYPSVMRDGRFPTKLIGKIDCAGRPHWPSGIDASTCIAAVKISTKQRTYPIRYSGHTTFARGDYWTVLCGSELQEAVASGHVRSVGLIQQYHCEPLFAKFVDYFWTVRQDAKADGQPQYESLAKTILNSLYGKWAQQSSTWIDMPSLSGMHDWGPFTIGSELEPDPINCRAIAGRVQAKGQPVEPSMAFPAISAFITSYARQRMRFYRLIAGPGRVLYQGTDSLHVLRGGYDMLVEHGYVRDGELGKLRLVGTHQGACYWGPVDYLLGGRLVRAGWKARGHAIGDTKWCQDEFEGPEGVIASRPDGSTRQWSRVLTHDKPWMHGTVGVDGWLKPLELPEKCSVDLEREVVGG